MYDPQACMHTSGRAPRRAGETQRQRATPQRLAYTLDSMIPLPGGYRIEFDGFIGLIPGLGELIGMALSSNIISQAQRLGIAHETLLEAVPVLGDLFDFTWKTNRRNVELLERHLVQPRQRTRAGVMTHLAQAEVIAFASRDDGPVRRPYRTRNRFAFRETRHNACSGNHRRRRSG